MAVFNNAQSSHSGEEYVFACLDWAFRQIGVEVHRRDRSIEELSPAFLAQYHRIFSNGVNWHPDFHEHPEVTCKVRTLHFWGNKIPGPEAPYDQRQILSPFPEDYNTFLGFFPHELVAQNRTIPDRHRGKEGLIVGKVAFLFQLDPDFVPAVQTLIDSGFTMHSVCREQLENNCGLPDGVVMHSSLSPEEYSQLIARMAFLIGAGAPIISPSPFVGWAQGAAWLNPFVTTNDPRHRNQTRESLQKYPLHWMHPPNTNVIVTQHTPISMLGAPYVYNVDLSDKASVVQAAYRAVRYRFASYAHPLFRPVL
ncbi:expressed unknown protein [Seminavis robusta]|uniref:alpha-1,6-mannosyl-glycoprotein 6-beta-N-acetylglucosaminyltransferase n=1 Tax=Seminavis robusta TaxID=568900 RepID=A0A9N8HCG4_9STRA|nr:expressed unknown protein [Seminavis robusta]|eukprot:Sro301_g111850.1 n/a (309) ;mRNA; f:15023-15949